MKIQICCDTYYPSVGGVQIVLQQIAERLVLRGHQVNIATSRLGNRKDTVHNGVTITEFDISGNYNRGLTGEVEKYRKFVLDEDYDVLLMKAAQSWSFDSIMDDIKNIKKRTVFIPCGFSGMFYPYYKEYYERMPRILNDFDHLIFYAEDYRDINLAKKHNINKYTIIPNGASEVEFSIERNQNFRKKFGISENDYLLMTVGTFTGGKGHTEIARAFELTYVSNPTTLILNGNTPDKKAKMTLPILLKDYLKMGPISMAKRINDNILHFIGINKKPRQENWFDIAQRVNSKQNNKRILLTNLRRNDLIQCFLNADLFVFASNIEYSPLVLFESAAAGLPFISVPVGNAKEIAEWTGAGVICAAESDKHGRTRVDPEILANAISDLLEDENKRKILSSSGKNSWKKNFTWDVISYQYEKVLAG